MPSIMSRTLAVEPKHVLRFCRLDRMIIENDVVEVLGMEVCLDKLFRQGVFYIGHLIAISEQDLALHFELNQVEVRAVKEVVQALRLSLGNPDPDWQAYRLTVPRFFQLEEVVEEYCPEPLTTLLSRNRPSGHHCGGR